MKRSFFFPLLLLTPLFGRVQWTEHHRTDVASVQAPAAADVAWIPNKPSVNIHTFGIFFSSFAFFLFLFLHSCCQNTRRASLSLFLCIRRHRRHITSSLPPFFISFLFALLLLLLLLAFGKAEVDYIRPDKYFSLWAKAGYFIHHCLGQKIDVSTNINQSLFFFIHVGFRLHREEIKDLVKIQKIKIK